MLEGKNIILRPVLQEDLPILFQWINSRDTVHYNAPYKPVTEEQHKSWFQAIQNSIDNYLFAIELKSEKKVIGVCQLLNVHNIHRNSELTIRIGDELERGKGFGLEATNLLLDFAFKDLNLYRVYLHVFITNERAISMYEKAGFSKEGVLRKAAYINGQYTDVVVMGLLREDI